MKNINVEGLKKLVNIKFVKKAAVYTVIGTIAFSTTGCSKDQEQEKYIVEDQNLLENENLGLEEENAANTPIVTFDSEFTTSYNNTIKLLSGKINNTDNEDLKSAVALINIDYIIVNDDSLLQTLYPNGLNAKNELNNLYELLSQVREYNSNLTSSMDFAPLASLSMIEKDQIILSKMDEYTKTIIDLVQNPTKSDKEEIKEIFSIVNAFFNGTGTIDVLINGETVAFDKTDLSNGGSVLIENDAQVISVLCQNIISEKERAALDKKLNSKDGLYNIEVLLEKFGNTDENVKEALIDGYNYTNTEVQEANVKAFNDLVDINYEEIKDFGVTREQVYCLMTIINADHFAEDVDNSRTLAGLYEDGLDLAYVAGEAEAAVEVIQAYNALNPDNLYNYGHMFIDSKEGILVTRALVETISNIPASIDNSKDLLANSEFNWIKSFNQYSNEAYVSYTEDNKELHIDKNGLDAGERLLVDYISSCAFKKYKSVLSNNVYNGLISLVDGSTQLDPYDSLVIMLDGYCANSHEVEYQYTR